MLSFYFNFNVYINEYNFKILNKLKYIKLDLYLDNILNNCNNHYLNVKNLLLLLSTK